MTTIAILPEQGEDQLTFSAVAGERQATGRTAGEALDALTSQLSTGETGAPVIVQEFLPDEFFSAAQRDRLSALMARWRAARDKGDELPPAEQAELERLVDEETRGATARAAKISRDLEAAQQRLRREDKLSGLKARSGWQALRDSLLSTAAVAAPAFNICICILALYLTRNYLQQHLSSNVFNVLSASALALNLLILLDMVFGSFFGRAEEGSRHGKLPAVPKARESSTEHGEHGERNKAR